MFTKGQRGSRRCLRVAAYCRVSTDEESQQNSYATQCHYYEELISNRPEWMMAGIYADEAVSGTSRRKRKQFNQMLTDAREGKVDYIITKSISRFARNTVDTLECVRQLKTQDPPVGVYFEKENLDSLDAKGELVLTILSALAQEESRSISDNIRWSFQKKFQAGIPQINLTGMLGYDRGEDGSWIINEPQAEIVRFIFASWLEGESARGIAGRLNEMGRTTVTGGLWRADAVLTVLRNEKYAGDLEMQKTVTPDFLTHQSRKNDGIAPKYYVENHHPAIIDRLTWERVQAAFRGREEVENGAPFKQENARQQHLYRLVCGECGAGFERHGYTGTAAGYRDERGDDLSEEERQFYKETWSYTYRVWRCETKYLGREGKRGSLSRQEREAFERQCPSPIVNETAIEQSFMELLYTLKLDQQLYGEESALARDFRFMCGRMEEEYRKNRPPDRQMELLDQQIAALEAQYREVVFKREGKQDQELACYDQLAEDIQSRIERYAQEKEKRWDIHGEAADRKRKFTLFCQCLEKLPDCNRAGQKLNIYGLNADAGPQEGAPPDFLEFDQAMYTAFVRKAIVKGDRIEFMTSFGVRLTCGGIDRNLSSFIGFRRADENGEIHLLTQSWQVNNARIQYRRKKRVYTGKRKGT